MATTFAVVGGGPAGLAAAEVLCEAGASVDLYEAMPSLGRKFLMAGKGGLNLTHAENFDQFLRRYGARQPLLQPALHAFGPDALRAWARALGVDTFVGTSGRVFPVDFKAAPLLRAWLHRLRERGLRVHVRHRWLGWDDQGALRFHTPAGEMRASPSVTVLALGGGSWARLGSDGAWMDLLRARGVALAPLQPANCGFDADLTAFLRERYAGVPVKAVKAGVEPDDLRAGEFVITATGVEGSLVYALSAPLRDRIASHGEALLWLDLAPGLTLPALVTALSRPRGKNSLANFLRRHTGLSGVKAALLHEPAVAASLGDARRLAQLIKCYPLRLLSARPMDEAISTAGGVSFDSLDGNLMLRQLPGVFCAGEMLDWEAPTGGYLLTACMATGRLAAAGTLRWLSVTP